MIRCQLAPAARRYSNRILLHLGGLVRIEDADLLRLLKLYTAWSIVAVQR